MVLTLGHSDHAIDDFFALVAAHGGEAVVDVRSTPYSRRVPWFDREPLRAAAEARGLGYSHRGGPLGGRPSGAGLMRDGVADYVAMAGTAAFVAAVAEVAAAALGTRQVLVCSERHPATCHRCLLVGRALVRQGIDVLHVDGVGGTVTQEGVEEALLARHALFPSLLEDRAAQVDRAYALQSRRHAFRG